MMSIHGMRLETCDTAMTKTMTDPIELGRDPAEQDHGVGRRLGPARVLEAAKLSERG